MFERSVGVSSAEWIIRHTEAGGALFPLFTFINGHISDGKTHTGCSKRLVIFLKTPCKYFKQCARAQECTECWEIINLFSKSSFSLYFLFTGGSEIFLRKQSEWNLCLSQFSGGDFTISQDFLLKKKNLGKHDLYTFWELCCFSSPQANSHIFMRILK